MENIIWIKELTSQDIDKVGKKAIELAKLSKINIPVPKGFVLNGLVFKNFIEENKIDSEIRSILKTTNIDDKENLNRSASTIQNLILSSQINRRLREDILEAYNNLDFSLDFLKDVNKEALNIIHAGKELPFVVLRSRFVKDLSTNVNIFCVKGNNNLLESIKRSYASMFYPDYLYNLIKEDFSYHELLIPIIIQKQVLSNKSGLIYYNENEYLIKACLGLNNLTLNYDEYFIDRENLKIINKKINKQDFYSVLDINLGKILERSLSEDKKTEQKLADYEISKLLELHKKIESSYNESLDLEFAIEGTNIFIIQAKPRDSFKSLFELYKEKEAVPDIDYGDVPLID